MIRRLSYDEAAALLAAGEVVALPTDTVYGVAASVTQPAAVARLFALKDRPADVALPMMAASREQVEAAGIAVTSELARLAAAFWPGALTIVVSAPSALAQRLGASEPTVGVRVPNDPDLCRLLERSGPLAVTSANVHGGPPCESAEQVDAVFAERDGLAGVVDGGERRASVSTVVDVTSTPWRVLREGAISRDALRQIEGGA
ncbi:MAG: threonylcarbamoyl-AMP synthase [Acidobacteriota bacterium]|nr:threonylcarbamoyl-AMP synthase [Acidobacteriota bacterium]